MSCWCAPAQPAPARIVTRLAALSASAVAARAASAGRMTDDVGQIGGRSAPAGASAKKISPGTTTTATPPRSTAARIAISRIHGSCSGMLTSSR